MYAVNVVKLTVLCCSIYAVFTAVILNVCYKVRIANVKSNKASTLYNASSYVVSLAAR